MNTFVKKLEFDKLHALKVDPTQYSGTGMEQISGFLKKNGYNELPPGFMRFVDSNSGKIATRVDKYVKAMNGSALTPKQKEEIGNIADRNLSHEHDVLYDFHYGILDWPTGHFGNGDSCWRKSYSSSGPMLSDGSGYGPGFVMRLFTSDDKGMGHYYSGLRGSGRIWMLPWEQDSIVAFNPYGQKIEWFADKIRIIMSNLTGLNVFVKNCSMSNMSEGLYANSGSSIVVTHTKIYGAREIETNMPKYETKKCNECRNYFARRPGGPSSRDGDYCDNCGVVCSVQKKWISKSFAIPVVKPVTVRYNNKEVTVSNGYVARDRGLSFCSKCLFYHGLEGCEHD